MPSPNVSMFSQYLSDDELADLCAEEQIIFHMLQFEIALARAQSAQGIIPAEAARMIGGHLLNFHPSPRELSAGTLQNGIPVITLLSLAKSQLPDDAKEWLHFGATSQDTMDTARVLIIKEVITVIEKRIHLLLNNFSSIISEYGMIPCMARSRSQHAIPIAFGLKITNWANPLLRHLERLQQMKPGLLVVQLGGAAGSLSAWNDKDEKISAALASELGLNHSIPWHNQRDGFTEFTNWLAMLSCMLGKMAADILILSQTEIAELSESTAGGGKSSTMPHKNNPVLSEAVLALAKMNTSLAATQLQSMIQSNERDGSSMAMEWITIPQMILNTGTALSHMMIVSKNMGINKERMRQNIDATNGLVFAEAAIFELSKTISRSAATELVNKACALVMKEKSLPAVLNELTTGKNINWEEALHPERHIGIAKEIMKVTIQKIEHLQSSKSH
ncbi:MAG: adenylosuccinate lyase family protein [Ferruginibacter sp.]